MSVLDWPRRAWNRLTGKGGQMNGALPTTLPDSPMDRYDIQEAYYKNNNLYQNLAGSGLGPGAKVRSLRNPAHRVIEFHASHLWPEPLDELPLKSKSGKEPLEKAAEEVLKWGNWGQQKEVAARRLPTLGDLYLKAEDDADSERSYPKLINPRHVTDFDKDSRGFAIRVRLDIPIEQNGKQRTRTEIYDKKGNYIKVWEHDRGPGAKEEALSDPITKESGALTEFNADFVPFSHGSFSNTGGERGIGAFAHALEPINELNKMASRVNDMFFRKNVWALKRNEAGTGAVTVEELARISEGATADEDVEVGKEEDKDTLIRLPGTSSLESLIPNIPYEAARGLMEDQEDELSQDLPELLYYVAKDKGDPSGRAISLGLAPAQDRAKEARANGEAAILQVLKMCLTIAKNKGAFKDIGDIGSFDNDDFDLIFEKRQILPQSDIEKAEEEKVKIDNVERLLQLGLIDQAEARKRLDIDEAVPVVAVANEGPISERQRELFAQLGTPNQANPGGTDARGTDGRAREVPGGGSARGV